eukprot:115747_1
MPPPTPSTPTSDGQSCIKLVYNDDIHRLAGKDDRYWKIKDVRKEVVKKIGPKMPKRRFGRRSFELKYIDKENDTVTLDSDAEIAVAMEQLELGETLYIVVETKDKEKEKKKKRRK